MKSSFPYTYPIEDKKRDEFVLYDSIDVSINLLVKDSIEIHFEFPEKDEFLFISILQNAKQSQFLGYTLTNNFKISSAELEESTFMVQSSSYLDLEFKILLENINSQFSLQFEKRTILNDPDSGGLIIHSKKELSYKEINDLIFCYLKNKESCFDRKECYISIIL